MLLLFKRITYYYILMEKQEATVKLPTDKSVEKDDAAGVAGLEVCHKLDNATRPGGVRASVTAAARLNQDHQ